MATKYNKYYQKTFNISTTMTSATFLLTYNLNYNFSLTDDDKLYYRVFFGLNDEEDNTYNGKLTFVPNSSEFMVTEGSKKIDNIKINLKNVDNTKTAAEIYITYSFNNLTDFLGKTYSIKYNNKTFLYLNFLMYKILVFFLIRKHLPLVIMKIYSLYSHQTMYSYHILFQLNKYQIKFLMIMIFYFFVIIFKDIFIIMQMDIYIRSKMMKIS